MLLGIYVLYMTSHWKVSRFRLRLPDSFAWRHEKPSDIVWTARAWGGTSRSHTSNIVPAKLAERVWCPKFQSSLLNIYFRLSGFHPSLLLIYFRDGPNSCSHCTEVWHKNLSDIWHSTSEIGLAPLRSVTEVSPPQPFFCVNRSPIRYDFPGGENSVRYSVDLPLAVQWRPINVHKRLDARAELLFWLLNPLRPSLSSPSWLVNPLSPNSDQHQFSSNNIHTPSRDKVMRINKMITKEKIPWSFIKFSQRIL